MENNEKLDLIIKNQEVLDAKLNYILKGLDKNDTRANTSIFIQGLFLSDLLASWGNLNGKGR